MLSFLNSAETQEEGEGGQICEDNLIEYLETKEPPPRLPIPFSLLYPGDLPKGRDFLRFCKFGTLQVKKYIWTHLFLLSADKFHYCCSAFCLSFSPLLFSIQPKILPTFNEQIKINIVLSNPPLYLIKNRSCGIIFLLTLSTFFPLSVLHIQTVDYPDRHLASW